MSDDRTPKTVEDYKAMYQSRQFIIDRYRDAWLRALMENAILRKLFSKLIDIFELDE